MTANPLDSIVVSMFPNVLPAPPLAVKLPALLAAMRSDRYAAPIHIARELFAAWKAVCPALDDKSSPEAQAYDRHKKTLPAFTMSGTCSDRKTPLAHSNLLQIDLDKLNGGVPEVRAKVRGDPHILFGFISPSGDGLKLGLRIDGDRHLESFLAAESYFLATYGVKIDRSVKDRLRLCFVSHDPDLWTNDNATQLPIPEAVPAEDEQEPEPSPEIRTSGAPAILVLPSGQVTVSESARAIFTAVAPSETLFQRGGALVELIEMDGTPSLSVLAPTAFRSRAEQHGRLFAWRVDDGKAVLKPVAKMSEDDSKTLLATTEARELLPHISSIVSAPVITDAGDGQVAIIGPGYHEELGGILVTGGTMPPQVPPAEAAASLKWLVEEFDFQSEGDRARALAAFITPALRIGGFLKGNVPIDVAEADQSQSGKGYRHDLICTLYRERSYVVTARTGGVGSMDESFAAGLVAGRPFIMLDNLRGRLDSQHLESFLTAPGLFPARVPRHGEVLINPKRFLIQLSSNGVSATRDLVNRSSICRIRKRPGFNYRDTLSELQERQPYFLGCVFSIIAEWVSSGKPKSKDCRHDFREWCQTLDWICRELLSTAPLLDGHVEAQERAANPALTWLRAVALAVAGEAQLPTTLTASEICELCDQHGVELPGAGQAKDAPNIQAGRLLAKVFRESAMVGLDGFQITRELRPVDFGTGGGRQEAKFYTFQKP